MKSYHLSQVGICLLGATLILALLPALAAATPLGQESAPTPVPGDEKARADATFSEGVGLFQSGDYESALTKFREARELYRTLGDLEMEADALTAVGLACSSIGQSEEALAAQEEALSLAQEANSRRIEGDALSNIAQVYDHLGRYQEALNYYQQALVIQREIGDQTGEWMTLHSISVIYVNRGQYEMALETYLQALAIAQSLGDRTGEGRILIGTGMVNFLQGEYDQALKDYQQALAISQEIGDQEGEGMSLSRIGVIYANLGQYQQALNYYHRALAIFVTVGSRVEEGMMLYSIGSAYSNLGQYAQALDFHQQALTLWKEIGVPAGEARTLNHIGVVYHSLGRYEVALDCFLQALAIHRELGEQAEEALSLSNIGAVYGDLGQYQRALDYLQEALTVKKEVGDRFGQSIALNDIGKIYFDLGEYEQALSYYRQTLVVVRDIGLQSVEGTTLSNIGAAYHGLGQYDQALDSYDQALAILEAVGYRSTAARTRNNMGWAYGNLGQYEQALEFYEQALAIEQEINDREGEGATLGNIGFMYESQGDMVQAIIHYQRAIEVLESIRAGIKVEELKTSFVGKQQQVNTYERLINLFWRKGRLEDAFNYVERARARAFLDQLGNVRVDPRATDDPNLLAREQELLDEVHALEAVLAGHSDVASLDDSTRGGPTSLTGEQRQEVQAGLDAAYRQYEQLLTRIKLTNPQYASLRSVQASTLITVQQTLPPGVTLLEYYVALDQTFAFVVTQDDFHVVSISVTPQDLSESITWLRSFPSLEGVPQASGELYDLLFAPVREHIHTDALYIAPHSVLHYLPFAALHDGERYLVEDYAIAYLPSASVLQYVLENVHDDAEGDLMALCNPEAEGAPYLNYAIAETEVIAALFNIQPILGPDATETRLWEQSPHASLVHIAAHGQFNPFAPQFSRIYLAPDDENDGYLEVREVFNLRLDQADLVTLSACETQLGELSAGDELVGLSRAFIYAGTPSLVATLWSVDDASTRFLMERFYGYLKEGRGKAAALRQAQTDTMEEYPSPYHWAPFTLIGEMGEVAEVGATAAPGALPSPSPGADGPDGDSRCLALPLVLVAMVSMIAIAPKARRIL